jgi:hypothetical protein
MLLYTLPNTRITILIVLLVSLYRDILQRMKEMRTDYLKWYTGESQEAALVLVSAEAALSKGFVKYARRLIAEQKLDRIVVNECHLTIVATDY